jgi:hypothetical protein
MEAVCSFETLVSTYKSIRVTIQKALTFPLPLAPQKSHVFILLVDFVKNILPILLSEKSTVGRSGLTCSYHPGDKILQFEIVLLRN